MTAPLLFIGVALAGGLGSAARFVLDGLIRSVSRGIMPWGTIAINVSGSLLLGLVTGLAAMQLLPAPWLAVLGVGFLGGYTTFSTASFETVRLLQQRRWAASAVNGLGVLAGSTLAAGLGLWIALGPVST